MKLAKKKKMMKQINYCLNLKTINDTLDNAELVCTKTDGTKYDFNHFSLPLKFIEKIYKYEITLDEATEKPAELKELINKLNRVLKSAKKLSDARDDNIYLFKKELFRIKVMYLKQIKKNQKKTS